MVIFAPCLWTPGHPPGTPMETIDFRIREKLFKHQYGGSPYNVALFLIFARNTSTVRTNLTNFKNFLGENASGPRPPLENPYPL